MSKVFWEIREYCYHCPLKSQQVSQGGYKLRGFLKDDQILSGKEKDKSIPSIGNRMYQSRQEGAYLMGLKRSFTKSEQRGCEEMSPERVEEVIDDQSLCIFRMNICSSERCKKSILFSTGYSVVILLIISYLFILKSIYDIWYSHQSSRKGDMSLFVLVAVLFVL